MGSTRAVLSALLWEMVKAKYGLYLGVVLLNAGYFFIGCIPCVNVFIMGPVMGGLAYFVLRDMRD